MLCTYEDLHYVTVYIFGLNEVTECTLDLNLAIVHIFNPLYVTAHILDLNYVTVHILDLNYVTVYILDLINTLHVYENQRCCRKLTLES